MDDQTTFILALQLFALCGIAGALFLYLFCKIRNNSDVAVSDTILGAGRTILVTSADTAIGLQISIHLANKGFRVFCGLKNGASSGSSTDTVSARVIRAWQKHRESSQTIMQGSILAFPLDITREDSLHEAVDIIRAHLPAGEDGIWSFVNTTGLVFRGKFDQQDIVYWDAMFKTNIIGLLRGVRAFQGLLRNTGGRVITLGSEQSTGLGLVGYTASRFAVEGASNALKQELSAAGIKVVVLNPIGYSPEMLYMTPRVKQPGKDEKHISVDINGCMEYEPNVLSDKALQIFTASITSRNPRQYYNLTPKNFWFTQFKTLYQVSK